MDPEILQFLFQQPGLHVQVFFVGGLGAGTGIVEKIDRRQGESGAGLHEGENLLLGYRLDRHGAGIGGLDLDLLGPLLFLLFLDVLPDLDFFLAAFLELDHRRGGLVDQLPVGGFAAPVKRHHGEARGHDEADQPQEEQDDGTAGRVGVMHDKGFEWHADDAAGREPAAKKRIVRLFEGQKTARGQNQQKTTGSQGQQGASGLLAEKEKTAQEEKKRYPEGADAKQPHQNAGKIGAEDAKQVVDRTARAGAEKQAGISRIEGDQTDQTEHHHEKEKNTGYLFFHRCLPAVGESIPVGLLAGGGERRGHAAKPPPERGESPAAGQWCKKNTGVAPSGCAHGSCPPGWPRPV
ncbi:hypothetical protein DESC_480254 [Desulfosarcina cetonica]|nr:hypothetical protein DESC_480254 [Desulfosarcina cetonica]